MGSVYTDGVDCAVNSCRWLADQSIGLGHKAGQLGVVGFAGCTPRDDHGQRKVMATSKTNTAIRDAWASHPTIHELTQHDIWALRRQFLERLWPRVGGWRVLEVGSGPAHDSLTFAQRGAQVTALDCSPTGLQLARQIYNGLGLPIRTVQASADQIPLDDGQFDVAFNAGVLEHFDDRLLLSVIDEMIRVVKPGGTVLAFCPNRYNLFYQANLSRVATHAYDFERAFTAKELLDRFQARGLVGTRSSGVHVHPAPNYLLPNWLPKHHRIEPCCRCAFGWLERMDGWHRLKSLIGQDFVVWGTVPAVIKRRRPAVVFTGGPAVRCTARMAA